MHKSVSHSVRCTQPLLSCCTFQLMQARVQQVLELKHNLLRSSRYLPGLRLEAMVCISVWRLSSLSKK